MPPPALNKTSLKHQRDQLAVYQRYLPSLDLKRQQFLALVKKEEKSLKELAAAIDAAKQEAGDWLPFAANEQITVQGLIKITHVEITHVNQLGVTVPQLGEINFARLTYSVFAKPLWVDGLVELLEQVCRLTYEQELARQRLALLRRELQVLTRRVNLFDQVLIPSTHRDIRRIEIALSDLESAAVVRAKIAKKKQQPRGA